MDTDAIRAYLTTLMTAITGQGWNAQVTNEDDAPVLYCAVPSEENEGTLYRLSILPTLNGMAVAEIEIILLRDVTEEAYPNLQDLIGHLNPCIQLGSLFLNTDAGTVVYTHGMLFGEEQDVSSVTELLAKSISMMEVTASNTVDLLKRCQQGEPVGTIMDEMMKEAEA